MSEEERNQKLIDAISRKERFTIRVIKKCNENGEFDISLNPGFKPRRNDASFNISLIDFATTNLVANVNESNNKFYYNNGTAEKVVTMPTGFYLIKSYNDEIKKFLRDNRDQEDAINIEINDATGFVNITLTRGYYTLFDKENTFRKQLGFDSAVLRGNGNHVAGRVCDLWPTQNIYLHCSAVKGNKKITIHGCEESDILYNFPCNQRYGAPITYQLNPRLTESDLDLSRGQLDRIQIRFTDDTGKPINFGRSQVNLALRISQV